MTLIERPGGAMRRRDFIGFLSGAVAAWPIALRAQPGGRMRRLGIIIGTAVEESETKARLAAFLQELKHLGWDEGRNVRIEMRASAGNAGAARKYAAVVAFAPFRHCLRQLIQCQLYSRLPLIRLGTAMSIVWRDRAAM